jgi:hypothetical protein
MNMQDKIIQNRLGIESVRNFVSIQSIASFFSRPHVNGGLVEKVC